ncbi:hypothetical protein [Roseomonas chloroacetimidivorans]|jgi:hypothetical protein
MAAWKMPRFCLSWRISPERSNLNAKGGLKLPLRYLGGNSVWQQV